MTGKVILLLMVILVAWGMWAARELIRGFDSKKTEEAPVAEAPVQPPAPVEEATPEPEPVVEAPGSTGEPSEQEKLSILDNRVRECLGKQKEAILPVAFDSLTDAGGKLYRKVYIVRLEPDGIHVRHAAGVDKIDFTGLPPELKARFFIEDDLALRYRSVIAERRRTAEQARILKNKETSANADSAKTPDKTYSPASPPVAERSRTGSGFGRMIRCEVCGERVPEAQAKVYRTRKHSGTSAMVSTMCCSRCAQTQNVANPYMQR